MSKFMRKTTLLAKTEVTPGTDAAPVGTTNAILIRNMNLTPLDVTYAERNIIRGFFGNFDALVTIKKVKLTFETELSGSGTAGTAPAWAPLMTACGTTETLVAVTSATYAPNSTNAKSLTMYVNIDGMLHKILYARGNFTIKIKANDIPYISWEFTGLDGTATDAAAPTPTFTAFTTPLAANTANTTPVTLHGISGLAIENFELNAGNQIEQITRIGGESIQQTDRKSTGSITFEMTSIATKDWFATVKAATLAAFTLTHGTVAGNKIVVAGSNVELQTPTFSDVQGIQMVTLGLRFNPSNAGSDEWSVANT